mgnify:FL=1|tara:strand:+ start:5465 stop:9718 length:4254 start_codon:yes stop_codon:yes gene_type:complete
MPITYSPQEVEDARTNQNKNLDLSLGTGFKSTEELLKSDVSESLLRADRERLEQTGGVTSFPTKGILTRRTREVEEAIKGAYGESLIKTTTGIPSVTDLLLSPTEKMNISAGLYDLGSFFVNNVAAVVNTALQPFGMDINSISGKDPEKYSKYYAEMVKKAEDNEYINPQLEAFLKTTFKIYSDTPEIRSKSSFVKDVLDNYSDKTEVISRREAEALTKYIRPNATIVEQVMRTIPEVAGFTAAGLKFAFRNSKNMVKQVDDALEFLFDKQKKKGINTLNATEDQINQASRYLAEKKVYSFLGSFRGPLRAQRLYRNAQQKRWLDNKSYDLLRSTSPLDKKVDYLRKRKKVARDRFKDNQMFQREQRALTIARQRRINAMPKELIAIPLTEVGAAIGANIGERIYGNEVGALFGALGGGFSSLVLFEGALKLGKRGIQQASTLFADLGQTIGKLSDDQVERMVASGKIPAGALTGLSKEARKAAEDFAFFIRSLPEDQRAAVYGQIKYVGEIRSDLSAAGVNEELLKTTIDKATGLVPLMIMRETLANAGTTNQSLSKDFSKLSKTLIDTLNNEDLMIEQIKGFRTLIDTLSSSAEKAGVKSEKLNTFVTAMRSFTETETTAISQGRANIDETINDIMRIIADPSINPDENASEKIIELIERIMSSNFMKRKGAEAGREELETGVRGFGEQAKELVQQVRKGDVEAESDVKTLLAQYFKPEQYQIDAENAGRNFARAAQKKQATFHRDGSEKFTALQDKDVRLDITDWLQGLYATAGEAGEVYSKTIVKGRTGKLRARLGSTITPNAFILQAFANVEATTNIGQVLRANPSFRKDLLAEMKELDSKLFEEIDAEGPPLNTFNVFKRFFQRARGDDEIITDFDVLILLKEFSKDINENASNALKVTVKPIDIQRMSSSFLRSSASTTDGTQSFKLGTLAESLIKKFKIDADKNLEESVREQIKEAKDYWLNNVVARYKNKEVNPIGYDLSKIFAKDFVKEPVKWLNSNKLFEGTSQDAADIIKSIKRTFGEYTGRDTLGEAIYEIRDEESLEQVRVLIQSLLYRHIGDQPAIQQAARLAKKEGAVERTVEEGRKRLRGNIVPKIINSPSIKILESEGFIDLEHLTNYNRNIERYIGRGSLRKRRIENLNKEIKISKSKNNTLFNNRQKALEAAIDYTGLGGASRKAESFEGFLKFFVEDDLASTRVEGVIPNIAKALNISEKEAGDLFSDITIEALSKASYGEFVDTSTAGEVIRNFDYEKLFKLVVENKEVLEKITGEKYNTIKRMAEYLRVINRDPKNALLPAAGKYTVPRGLSVESLLSRAYSISRGIISPKYVATEVALLGLRKKKAQALSEILQNPKVTDAVIAILESDGAELRKYRSNIFTTLINGLAYHERIEQKEKTDRQMKDLEKARLK